MNFDFGSVMQPLGQLGDDMRHICVPSIACHKDITNSSGLDWVRSGSLTAHPPWAGKDEC